MSTTTRTALITGAGQGMGLGVAKRLAAGGARIIINDIDPSRAEAAAREVADAGGDATPAAFDITDAEETMAAIGSLEREVGGIDVLVNNAGNAGRTPWISSPSERCRSTTGSVISA